MTHRVAGLLATALAAGLACARTSSPDPPRARAPAPSDAGRASSAAPGVPMFVEWAPRRETARQLELVARVVMNVRFTEPVQVWVTLPDGVRLVRGPERFTIDAPTPLGPVETTYVFAVDGPARGAIVLEADVRGEGFGVHAKKPYRLAGSTEPEEPPTAGRDGGPHLETRGRDFGPSVPTDADGGR